MTRSMEVTVGQACVGSGTCRQVCPDVFAAGDDQRAVVRTSPVPEDGVLAQALWEAPVEALSARDAATGEVLYR